MTTEPTTRDGEGEHRGPRWIDDPDDKCTCPECGPTLPASPDAGWEDRLNTLGEAPDQAGVHTACDKWIRVERGQYGTKIRLYEPERGLGSNARTMWANLSPRDVRQLIDALNAACPRAAELGPS